MDLVKTDDSAAARVWLRAARGFIERPFDEAINGLLAALAPLHRADRAWVMRYSEDLAHLSNSHEWARDGVKPYVDELQNVPAAMMGSLHDDMLRGATSYFDVMRMPVRLRLLQEEFLRQGNRAVLCLPLRHEGRLVGMFGYDAVRERVEWPAPALAMLRDAGGLIAAALARSLSRRPGNVGGPAAREVVFVAQGGGRFAVPLENIVLFAARGDYSRLEIADGAALLQPRSLAAWEKALPEGRFVRAHRGFLVSRARIRGVETLPDGRWALRLEGRDEAVPVGRRHREAVRRSMAAV